MQICFIQDYLRASWDEGNAERCGRWLHALIGPALRRRGHHTYRLSHTHTAIQTLLTKSLNLGWPALFSDPGVASCHAGILSHLKQADLVIGFELSPNQMRVLYAAGVPFIDVAIDPIRFERDIFLALRTNMPALAGALASYETHTDAISYRRRPPSSVMLDRPGKVLFAGQTDIDASLVTNGRIGTIDPYLPALREQLGAGETMWLKPHPYGRVHQSILKLHEVFTKSRLVTDNMYAMLASGEIARVITLSSGVAYEAPFFGIPATTLLIPDVRHVENVSRTIRLSPDALPLSLWRNTGRSTTNKMIPKASLRSSLGLAWAYPSPENFPNRSVEHDDVIEFSNREARSGVAGLCGFGWSHPETTGYWTNGPLATLLVQPPSEPFDLSLQCRAYVPPGTSPLRLTIEVRGTALYRRRLTFHSQRIRMVRIPLPHTDGLTEIALHIHNPRIPGLSGLSDDHRALGLHVISARFHRRPAKVYHWLASTAQAVAASAAAMLVSG